MKSLEKMTDTEVQERMNQLYGEYTKYWSEMMRRQKQSNEKVK